MFIWQQKLQTKKLPNPQGNIIPLTISRVKQNNLNLG